MIDAVVRPISYLMVLNDSPHRFSEPSASPSSSNTDLGTGLEALGMALVPMIGRFATAVMPLAQAVHETLRRPDVQAKLAAGAQALLQAHHRVAAFEAPGYTPYFECLGHSGFSARAHALVIRSFAERFYRESRDRRVALSALHDLAGRSGWHPALARQVERLRENCGSVSFLSEAFRDAGCPALEDEFVALLHGIGGGDHAGGPRLIAIAKRIVPHAPSPRGRSVAFDTVLHQTFLRWSAELGGRRAYTYGLVRTGVDAIDDFTDAATAATRIELKRPSFNPVAARRAERMRLARKPRDETGVDRG